MPLPVSETSFQQALDHLYQIRLFGTKLGLENVRALCDRLGRPQDSLRFIHIAGTNGKGSVAAMLARILELSCLRTGLFTSPHLVSFCERIRVDGHPVPSSEVVALLERLKPLMREMAESGAERHPTFFEVVVAMALEHFKERGVQAAVWETGMGGRLDATNLVDPVLTVITSVGFDHMQYLGNTLAEIAAEKAGILKPGIPCVSAVDAPEAAAIIAARAAAVRAPLARPRERFQAAVLRADAAGQLVRVLDRLTGGVDTFELGLLGRHQVDNALTVLTAVEELRRTGFVIGDGAVREGFASTVWPGRLQVVRREPPLILDGAHNLHAAEALAESLGVHFPGMRFRLVFGVLKDKQGEAILRALAPLVEEVLAVKVNSQRAEEPEATVAAAVACGLKARTCDSLGEALKLAREGPSLLAGSLYLVGQAEQELGLIDHEGEIHANELL